jgi:hypothetical protein
LFLREVDRARGVKGRGSKRIRKVQKLPSSPSLLFEVHERGNVRLDFKGKVRYEGWKEGVESDTFVLVSG